MKVHYTGWQTDGTTFDSSTSAVARLRSPMASFRDGQKVSS